MNCKQIREKIDTASRHDLSGGVRSHLNDCPDCRRYSDETASLLELLRSQPRVEVPTDFEFRLRARMARAQDAAESGQHGLLRKIFPEKFSWGQTVAAAATITMVVTISIFYAGHNDQSEEQVKIGAAASLVDPQGFNSSNSGKPGRGSGIDVLSAASVKAATGKFIGRSARTGSASYQFEDRANDQSEATAEAALPDDIAGVDSATRLYNPKTKRLLNDRSRFYGAETVSISASKPAGAVLTF